jgi:DNA polymerase delta subunit 1
VLTSSNLASFSLVDCVQSLLGQTLEVLAPHRLAALAGIAPAPAGGGAGPSRGLLGPQPAGAGVDAQMTDSLRLARYSMRRVEAVRSLLSRLATLPEAIEMARATGLTFGQARLARAAPVAVPPSGTLCLLACCCLLPLRSRALRWSAQVMYNAQMVRTWSLLLRAARRAGFLLPARRPPLSRSTPSSCTPWKRVRFSASPPPFSVLTGAFLPPPLPFCSALASAALRAGGAGGV